jgi:hypothetical protein
MISLAERERFAIFVLFSQSDWGGSEAALLARDDVYQALDLDGFEGLDLATTPATALSNAARTYALEPALVEYLVGALPRPGQSRDLGRISARILRRLRAVGKDSAGSPGVNNRPPVNGIAPGDVGDPAGAVP